ncbi:copper chaperone PCu(A)C [Endozoicomonadaceae bacterium StTr2]
MRVLSKIRNMRLFVILLALFWGSTSTIVSAMDHKHHDSGDVMVEGAWIMAPPGPNAAGYLKLTNKSDKTLKLVDADSDVAKRVELHTHLHENGVMKMTKMDHVLIDQNQTHAFKQGSDHVMFMGLKQPLKPGEVVVVELKFENHAPVTVKLPVLSMEEAAKMSSSHSH